MKKEFIPYEQALELKEIGYDIPSISSEHGNIWEREILYQQAFRWFRDKKLSDSCVCRYQSKIDGGIYYYYVINHDYGVEETKHYGEAFSSYEEAELACLNKLMKIVRANNLKK